MRAPALLLVASCLLGCGSSEPGGGATPGGGAPDCDASLVGTCASIASARVRVGGAWRDVDAADVHVDHVDATTAAVTLVADEAEAFEIVIAGVNGAALLQQGYQSWGFSGAVKMPASVPMDADGSIAAAAARTGSPLDEAPGVSYGATVVGGAGLATAIGAASSATATTAIAVTTAADATTAKVTVVYGAAREALPKAASGRVESAPIVIAARQDANAALDALASHPNAGARAPRRPPGGWYSWNELFAEVTEEDVLDHVAIAKEKLLPKGLPLVEIDDGWEGLWGDWTANAKFPSGMEGVGEAITGAGLVAGVWMAPFLVDTGSDAAKKADPSWFVRDANGEALVHQPPGLSRTFHVLDGTNPAAMEVAAAPIRALRKAGFTFFKLDYLYAGALPGGRKDARATGTMALGAGLATLRGAMGEDAWLNACGAPIFPLVGVADSLRVGTDTAFAPLSLAWADVAFAARSLSARAFLAPRVWMDADQTQVRAPYTADEARASAVVAAMAGPAYALGDDLRKLPPDRLALALADDVIDLAGASAPARADDPLESPVEAIPTAPLLDTIANAGGTGAPPPSRFTMKGASGAAYTITFDWQGAHTATIAKE